MAKVATAKAVNNGWRFNNEKTENFNLLSLSHNQKRRGEEAKNRFHHPLRITEET